MIMLLKDLMYGFTIAKERNALNLNELLDFTQKCYINGEISIAEYKKLYFELNKLGAKKPESFICNNRELMIDVS